MEQTAVLALLLAAVVAFLAPAPQQFLRNLLHRRPAWIFAAPPLLTAVFTIAAALSGVSSLPLALLVLAYTAAPVLCAYAQGAGPVARPSALDFLTVLLLWLPLEFSAGASLIPRPAQGFLHGVAYGIAILLGLVLFVGFRSVTGLKYNLPHHARDYWLPLTGFAVAAPALAVVGIALGFIPPPHAPTQSAGRMISAAGVIFGCGPLDNGPLPLPNWRYMILATIAGVAYGWVFEKASTVLSSAALHMLVDWTKHFFF